ncbi:MAG: rRNA methyltransferase [Proteobacteria bacterium]|nr:rRNA methyltransferase [Pseudomonadota bacterium]
MSPRARRDAEVRLHGVNACLAAFAHRPDDLRKLWLTDANIPAFKPVLTWCVQQRIGYRVVAAEEIERLTASSHHEGVCMALRRRDPPTLVDVLAGLGKDEAALLLWLHGVGNPHNLGAILRSAAHFGVRAALVSDAAALSPAAYRVAEGGAEAVPCVPAADVAHTCDRLHRAGFQLAATVVRGGDGLYEKPLPARLVLLLGAEQTGLPQALTARADLRLRIPGTGAVESLNVSVAAALLIAEWGREQGAGSRKQGAGSRDQGAGSRE